MFLLRCHRNFSLTGKSFCLWLFSGHRLSPNDPFPSCPVNSCMGNPYWPLTSHLNPQPSLLTCSPYCFITSAPSYGTLLTTLTMCQGRPSPANIGNQVLLSPQDQHPSPLFPKQHGPIKVILVTSTSAKLEGLPYWIHLSHCKPFTCWIFLGR